MSKEYIWHCPKKECRKKGSVLLKTSVPFLGDEGKVRCSECKQTSTFEEISKFNKKNIEKYLQELSNNG